MEGLLENAGVFMLSLPLPLKGIVLLLIGFVFALIAKILVSGFLGLIRVNRIAERTGFSDFLRKGNVGYTPAQLGGVLAFYIVLAATFLVLALILDPGIIVSLNQRLRESFPALAAAVLITIVGLIGINFVANLGRTIAQNVGIPNADLIGRTIKVLGYIVVVLMALDQIGLGGSTLNTLMIILFAALSFGAALAFGLGCKDLAGKAFARFLQDLRERNRESKGTDLEG